MNKKLMIALAVVLVLLIILGISLGMGKDAPADPTTESALETTEATVPGMEDNIFDLPPEELAALIQTEAPTETKPTATVPTGAPDGNDGSDSHIEAPEPPKSGNSQTGSTGNTQDSTQPTEAPPKAEGPVLSEYERFLNMTPAEQQAYMESFESIEAFFEWYNKAKAEYEAANPPIEVGDGKIDLKDYE